MNQITDSPLPDRHNKSMGGCKENGSFGKGLEKLFRRWDTRPENEEECAPIPYLPPVDDNVAPTMWGREIRLMVLLCLSIALLCLNGISLKQTDSVRQERAIRNTAR